MVSLQSGRLAVLLSVRHDPAAVDVSRAGREWETLRNRNRAFRGFGHNQWSCHLAVPMDTADTRVRRTRLPRMSPKRRREQAIYDQRASEFLRRNTSATRCVTRSAATGWRW